MSEYVPRPDREGINAPERLSPWRDVGILLLGSTIILGALYLSLGWLGERIALSLGPETEQRIFGGDGLDQALGMALPDSELQRLLDEMRGDAGGQPLRASVLCDETPNALAVPGGKVLVTSSLLRRMKTRQGLGFVLAHEVGHFVHRDHLRGIGRATGGLVFALLTQLAGETSIGPGLVESMLSMTYSRAQEEAADRFALTRMQEVFGSTVHAGELFELLLSQKGFNPHRIPSVFSTHPHPEARLERIREITKTEQASRGGGNGTAEPSDSAPEPLPKFSTCGIGA